MNIYNIQVYSIIFFRCKENCKEKKIVEDVISFTGKCTSNCPGNIMIKWNLFKQNKNTGAWDPVSDLTSKTISNISSYSFVLKKKVLDAGANYVIRMSAWDAEGVARGISELHFITSIPPYGGICRVSPYEGIALETLFTIRCDNWTMETEPATYKFAYSNVYTDLVDILYVTSDHEVKVQLPAGHPEKNSILQLSVTVTDYDGMYTVVNIPVKVSYTENKNRITVLLE